MKDFEKIGMASGSVCGSIPMLVTISQLRGFEIRLKPSRLRGETLWSRRNEGGYTRERGWRALTVKQLGQYFGGSKD